MVSYLTSAIAMAVAMLTLNHRHIEALAVTKIPPGTELKRFATVTGSTVANDAFWARVCQSIPPGARYLALEMTNVVDASNVVDFFRPVDGATFCDMLTSSDKHRYSPDGLTYWVTPEYSSVASIRGGSADNVFQNFPVDLFKDEKRLVLSVWGHSGTTGDNRRDQRTAGCCSSSSNRTLTHPKLSINGDFTYWGQEFVFSYVADIDTTTTTLSTSTTEQTGCCVITTGLFTPEVTCEGGRTLIWCNDVLANLDPSAVWAETTFEVGTTCAEASALCPTTTAATTVAAVATTTVAHDASNAEKGGDATAGQTLYNSKPEKCRKDEACGYAIHCIFLGKKSENDCSLCSASKRECEVVAAERNARNVNSPATCEDKEYIFPATHRSFAKCRKLVGNSYKNKMDNKAELLLSRGQRSDCSRYIFDYRGDQQSAAEQFWNSSGAAADTLAWNVCGVGPSWFQVSCGRALITQLFLSTFDDIFTSYEKFDNTTTITDVDADASGENGVVGNETSATALLTPDGQCRYGVTSVLSSFAEDCHKASKRLKRRLKQANSLSTKDTLEPNEEITCRCVSKEEMQVANLNRLTLRKNLFEDTYHIYAAGFGGVVIFGIMFFAFCCFAIEREDCEACCAALLVGIGITIGVCMMFIWYPEQGFRRQAKFNTIRPDDANAYWQGCGETITMDLTFSPADRGLTYNDDGNVWTVGVPDTQTAVSTHHMSMEAKVNGSESEPATCKKAYVCSLSYNFMEVPHCIFSSTSENDCSLCFFAKSDCRIAAAQRNARSSSSATACDEGKYLMPATDRKFAECKSVSSGYTNRKSNKQSRIEGRAQRSECSKYALVADDQSTQAELFWLSEDDLMNQTSWGVCERGPSWFKKACIAAHTHPSVGGAATNRYMPSGFIGTAATDDLLSVDGECRYGVTSVLSSFGEDCHTASKKLKKRLKQSDSILKADDLEPNGEITCRCVSKTEMEVAHLSQFSNFYDRASRALKQRINKFRAATNHASDFWNGCGIGSAAGNPIPYFASTISSTTTTTISTTATSSTTTTTTTTTIATTATTTLFNATYECSDDTRVVAQGNTGSDAENNSPMLFGFALPLWFLPETSISAPLLDETSVEDLQSCQDLCASITGCISMTFAAGIEGDASPGSLAGANRRSIRSSGSGSGSMSGDDVDDDGSGVQVAAKHDGNSSNCKMYGEASMRDPDAKIDVTGITEPHAGTVYCVIDERQKEAMALRRRTSNKNDINDFGKLAGIGGGIVLVTIVHYYLNPNQRDFDLYLLVTGGLLDAATDSVYLATEDFQSWELKLAATFVMTLPIVLVALGFWAVIFIDYRKRPWRRLLLPIEGPLKLVFVIYAGSTAFGVAAAARIVQGPLFFHNILFDDDFFLRSSFNDLWDTLFTEEEVFVVDEDENGGDITVDKKFWEKGLTQLLLAFLGFPILVIIVVSIFIATVVVVWAIGIAVTLISICVAALIGALFAVLLPIMFAILAFFRLFVLLPTIWKGITNLTIAFAEFAGNRFLFSSCFNKAEFSGFEDGAIFFSAEMAETIRYKTFHILDDSANEKTRTKINTLKKTTVNYLVLEFAFESVPQMSIQVINNEERQNWSAIGIASLIVSVYAIASTLYKYGYERFCKTRYDKNGKKLSSNA